MSDIEKPFSQVPQPIPHEALVEALGAMSGRELQAVLLDTFTVRADSLTPQELQRQYETGPYTLPCPLSQYEVVGFEHMAINTFSADVDFVDLSPVAALGANSVLSTVSQRTVMATSRNTEVVADGVTSLTLEAARRYRQSSTADTDNELMRLGTFHREMRTQQHLQPGFTSHFHALSLVSAQKTAQPEAFAGPALAEHVTSYLEVIRAARGLGYQASDITIALSNVRVMNLIAKALDIDKEEITRQTRLPGFDAFKAFEVPLPDKVPPEDLPELIDRLPASLALLARPLAYMQRVFAQTVQEVQERFGDSVQLCFDLGRHAGMGYYQDAAVKVSATNTQGAEYPLVDIGTNDWMGKLLSDKRYRLITGGMGTELFMKKF